MNDIEKYFDWRFSLISAVSWEILQNFIISLVIAFVGGFLAAAGKKAHLKYCNWRDKRKSK